MCTMHIETVVEVERDTEGRNWHFEDVEVAGEVDLAADTVTITTDVSGYSERDVEAFREALWLEASRRQRSVQRTKQLAEALFGDGVAMLRAVR